MRNVDWTVVRTAATAALIVLVPSALIAGYSLGDEPARAWTWVFLTVAAAGFLLAGFVAGRLRLDTPLLHGGLAAMLAFVVAQVFGIVVVLARGDSIAIVTIALTALLSVTLGVAGGLISDWAHRRSKPAPTKAPSPSETR